MNTLVYATVARTVAASVPLISGAPAPVAAAAATIGITTTGSVTVNVAASAAATMRHRAIGRSHR